jgi:hypothetical protein
MTRLMVAGSVSEALALTERAPMAGLTDLLRCVRTEVFGWTWEPSGEPSTGARAQRPTAGAAVAVVCDAVAAAFHAAQLSSSLTHQLIEPWAIAQADQPGRAVNLGPCHVEVDALLSRLATLDEDGRRRLLEIGHAVRAQGAWAPSMHSATWAVHMADRVRQGAVAQLRAVRVLRDTELSVTDAAAGTWNLVSGAVQAALVNDLLDDATHERLLAPVLGALS